MTYDSFILAVTIVSFAQVSGAQENRNNVPSLSARGSPYLFVWAGDARHKSTDFLAVIDVDPASLRKGSIISTVPVGISGTRPHHTEYEFPQGNWLFANGWIAGRTFIFDLSQPLRPRIAGQFTDRAGYSFPHSFVRLPNGHLLGTFQSHGTGYAPGGGLVEVDANGSAIRSASAVDPAVDKDLIWPYSLIVVPERDLVISSSTPMGWSDWAKMPPSSWPLRKVNEQITSQVQIWRLSDLRLLHTLTLPTESEGKHQQWPAEPRVLPDGSIYVNTFRCGLYLVKDVSSARPSAQRIFTFPGGESDDALCAVPVVVGHYWIQTVAALPGVIVLDVSHPEKPFEVSRLRLDARFHMPHWLAADRRGDRLVLTGDDQDWVLVLRFDADKGDLSIDSTFHERGTKGPEISFNRTQWPHGKTGPAVVHGALFGPR